jgi:hypothetical protein
MGSTTCEHAHSARGIGGSTHAIDHTRRAPLPLNHAPVPPCPCAAPLQPARAAVDCSVDGYVFHPYKTSPGSDVWTDTDMINEGSTVGTGDDDDDYDYEDPSFMAFVCDEFVAGCIGFDSQFRYLGRVKSQVRARPWRLAAVAAAGRLAAATQGAGGVPACWRLRLAVPLPLPLHTHTHPCPVQDKWLTIPKGDELASECRGMWVSSDVKLEMKEARWFGYKPPNNATWQAAKQRNFQQFKTVGAELLGAARPHIRAGGEWPQNARRGRPRVQPLLLDVQVASWAGQLRKGTASASTIQKAAGSSWSSVQALAASNVYDSNNTAHTGEVVCRP